MWSSSVLLTFWKFIHIFQLWVPFLSQIMFCIRWIITWVIFLPLQQKKDGGFSPQLVERSYFLFQFTASQHCFSWMSVKKPSHSISIHPSCSLKAPPSSFKQESGSQARSGRTEPPPASVNYARLASHLPRVEQRMFARASMRMYFYPDWDSGNGDAFSLLFIFTPQSTRPPTSPQSNKNRRWRTKKCTQKNTA